MSSRVPNPYEASLEVASLGHASDANTANILLYGYFGVVVAGILGFVFLGSNQQTIVLSSLIGGGTVACIGAIVFGVARRLTTNGGDHRNAVLASSLSGAATSFIVFAIIFAFDYPRGVPIRLWTFIAAQMTFPVAIGAFFAFLFASVRRAQLHRANSLSQKSLLE